MLIDTRAELTVCTKKLADKIGLTYRQDKVIKLITVDGKKNRTCGVVEEANIKIANAVVPMNIHIVDSKDETFLIRGDWLNRYQADLSYGKKEVTFKAQGKKITVKLTTNQPKQKVNYLGVNDSPPPPYQPTIEISDDDSGSDDESIPETYISARSRITEILNDLEQRERRGQQPISKEDLKSKINIWMVKCEKMKQTIHQYKAEEQLLIPEDELMAEMETKMKAAQWEEVTGKSPTAYLTEQEWDETAYNFQISERKEEEEEEDDDIAREVEELLREY